MSDKSIESLVQECLTKKLEDGTLERLVDNKIEEALGKVIDDTLNWCGDTYKLIKSKTAQVMSDAIERCNFADHTAKLSEVIDNAFENSSVHQYGRICKNIKELLDNDDVEFGKTINLDSIVSKYETFLQEYFQDKKYLFDIHDIEEDGEYGYVNLDWVLHIIKRHTHLDIYDITLFVDSDDEGLTKDTTITFSVRGGKYDEGYSIYLNTDWRISEIHNLNEVLIYLLKLKQNFNKIALEPDYDIIADQYINRNELHIDFIED